MTQPTDPERVPHPVAPPAQSNRHDPVYDELVQSAEFKELRRRYAVFVLPATLVFLGWYLLYVLASNWAHDFMSERVVGHINVALIFGVLQFVSTFLIAWLYARHMNSQVDELAAGLEKRYNQEVGR